MTALSLVPEAGVKECRSCKARIVWATTFRAGREPVDAEPSIKGNIRLVPRRPLGPGEPAFYARHLSAIEIEGNPADEPLFLSHFATCPEARKWRR